MPWRCKPRRGGDWELRGQNAQDHAGHHGHNVGPENRRPQVKFAIENETRENGVPNFIEVDASRSEDHDGTIVSYAWTQTSGIDVSLIDSNTSSAKDINTSEITIGADRKNDKNRIHGFAFRFGSDDIDVGNLGSALDMDALSLTFYETRPSINKMFTNMPEEIERIIWKFYFSSNVVSEVNQVKSIWFMGSFDIAILKSWRAGAATFNRGLRGGPMSLPDKFAAALIPVR